MQETQQLLFQESVLMAGGSDNASVMSRDQFRSIHMSVLKMPDYMAFKQEQMAKE